MSLDFILIGIIAIASVLLFITLTILYFVGLWHVFEDVQVRGWQCLIPGWNLYVLCREFWSPYAFIAFPGCCLIAFVGLVGPFDQLSETIIVAVGFLGLFITNLILSIKLSHIFGLSTAFGVGIALLPSIFLYLLAQKIETTYAEDYSDYTGYENPYFDEYADEPDDGHFDYCDEYQDFLEEE